MKILKFSTPACTYCKVVDPHIKAYAHERNIQVEAIDAEADRVTADKYDVMSVPVMVFEEDGKILARATGLQEIMALLNHVE